MLVKLTNSESNKKIILSNQRRPADGVAWVICGLLLLLITWAQRVPAEKPSELRLDKFGDKMTIEIQKLFDTRLRL